MNCPHCHEPSLVETMTKGGVLVDVCKTCKGVWLDRGEVFFFSQQAQGARAACSLPRATPAGSVEPDLPALPAQSRSKCPSCGPILKVDQCPECEGYWFDAGELEQGDSTQDRQYFQLETEEHRRRVRGRSAGRCAAWTPASPIAPRTHACGCRTSPRECYRCPTSGCVRPA